VALAADVGLQWADQVEMLVVHTGVSHKVFQIRQRQALHLTARTSLRMATLVASRIHMGYLVTVFLPAAVAAVVLLLSVAIQLSLVT
jgi:hypothetical protein